MNTPASQQLILVDGSSYLYRAFHALPELRNTAGEDTGAIRGVLSMLRRLLDEHAPTHFAVVFDAPGKTFRDELYPAYKANRPGMPDALRGQVQPLKDMIVAMGLPLIEEPGVEADDVIGTLTRRAEAAGWDVLISTGDKDLAQLVNERVTLLNTMSGVRMDTSGVQEKFGVPPAAFVDYLALVGDSSDNIPGIPGVGPKTAAKWLAAYGDLDSLVAAADQIKGKVGERLRDHLDQLPLARQLATICCDLSLDQAIDDLVRRPPDNTSLRDWYRRFEFRAWLEQLESGDNAGSTSAAVDEASERSAVDRSGYQLVLDQESFDAWLERLRGCELFALDLETDALDYMVASIVGVCLAVGPGEACYIPVAHDYPGAPSQLDRDTVLSALKPLLEDAQRPKLGQNLKFDMSVLAHHGISLRGIRHDTMLASYVIDSTATRHDMDSLARRYLGIETIRFEDVAGKGARQLTFNQVPLDQAAPYAAEDADVAWQLHATLWPRLQAEPRLQSVYADIEMPLVPVLSTIERTGVLIDVERLRVQSAELSERLRDLEARAHLEAGGVFNLASPRQIQEILFERQGLPVLEKTPKGQPSTAESVLQELAHTYPLPRLILEHRALAKLISTYAEKLPRMINPHTGRVHTSYHQAVTATGRLSSSDPNLQNIPVRTVEGRRIRKAFVAPAGYRLIAADYSQVELRIMAHLSEDPGLLTAFSDGLDVHLATAAEVFGVPLDAVGPDQRRAAKAINFGLMYGMSAFGLARQIGVERAEAQAYVDRYFERYVGVRQYLDRTREAAREKGYVETVFGRRLHVPEITARNAQRRQYAERTAINAPMQGSAADIIKRAMIAVQQWLDDTGQDARMIMQVHDELVFEVPEDQVDRLSTQIVAVMTGAAELKVPLDVDVGVGSNWDEAH